MKRGIEAQRFLQYLNEGEQYFKKIFEEIDRELIEAINGLDPSQQMEFTILQAKRASLYEPIKRVQMDRVIGIEERNRTEGKTSGGLL